MYSYLPVYASERELDERLSNHLCMLSPDLQKHVEEQMMTMSRHVGFNVISFSFFCLKTNRVIFHSSRYDHFLKHSGVNVALKNNRTMINRLTHADDVEFWADFNLDYYKMMMELPPEEQKKFWAIGSRRLLEKDGEYHTYCQQLSHFKSDDSDCPVIIMLQTIRQDMVGFPQFRFFSPCPASYTESHKFSDNMYKLKLSERGMNILDLYSQGCTQDQIAKKIKKSLATVKENVKEIKKEMDVPSIMVAGEIWKMIKERYMV